jgi:transglutaminase-like putative cysteine protease
MWGNRLSFWLDRDGSILKEEGFMGLVMTKSSAANAPMNIETGNEDDFYELSAVSVDKKIPRPNKLKALRLRIKDTLHLNTGQSAFNDGKRQTYVGDILEITREGEPLKADFTLPYNSDDVEFRPYLVPEFNIESDEEEIVRQALKIIGDNREPVSCAGKIMEWVYRNLEKRPVVNVPSALEVIRAKAGDCNEHATLLTALLRAVGIPARICVGLVYSRDKFFYHAWNEVYVGEWITMDATLNQMPADVSHVRLMRGNLDKQVEIIGVIGKLELEVIDFDYD